MSILRGDPSVFVATNSAGPPFLEFALKSKLVFSKHGADFRAPRRCHFFSFRLKNLGFSKFASSPFINFPHENLACLSGGISRELPHGLGRQVLVGLLNLSIFKNSAFFAIPFVFLGCFWWPAHVHCACLQTRQSITLGFAATFAILT